MNVFQSFRREFSNHRQWRDFLAAVQCSVAYPSVVKSLRVGAERFNCTVVRAPGFASIKR